MTIPTILTTDAESRRLGRRLDADDRLRNMALMRKVARGVVNDIHLRMASVSGYCRCAFADAPDYLARWAIGHSIAVETTFTANDVIVRIPISEGRDYAYSVLTTYTCEHATEMAAYLLQWICRYDEVRRKNT